VSARYYAGWDGGGTKTTVALADECGQVFATRTFGPLNANGNAPDCVASTVQSCLQFMADDGRGLEGCIRLVIGMAGVSSQSARDIVARSLEEAGWRGEARLVGDHEITLAGALVGHGAVLIAGTGSVLLMRDRDGRTRRAGGCGHLIDDGGSGYAIGRDMLAAVVRARDGRAAPTCLDDMVAEKLGTADILSWLYARERDKRDVAALAPLLEGALAAGDAAAKAIALRAVDELETLVLTGPRDGELAFSGGVLRRGSPIRTMLEERLREKLPGLDIHDPIASPAEGAVRMAIEPEKGGKQP